MRLNLVKYSLNGGEISPLSTGRVDLERYPTCLERCQNWVPLIQGGVTRRPGMRYICPAMGPSRLIPFIFDLTHAYVLEFGNQLLQFYTRDGQIITSGGRPSFSGSLGITTVDNGVTWICRGSSTWTSATHEGSGVSWLIDSNGNAQQCVISGITDGTAPFWNPNVGGFTYDGSVVWQNCGNFNWKANTYYGYNLPLVSPLTSNSIIDTVTGTIQQVSLPGFSNPVASPYQISSPYNTATDNLWDIKFVQIVNTMYLTHPNHPPMKLNRLSDINWVLTQPSFYAPPTHDFDQDISGGTVTITLSATSGIAVTVTASANIFITGDIGRAVVSGVGVGFITAIGGATSVDGVTGATLNQTATINIIDAFTAVGPIAAGTWFLRGSPQSYIADGSAPGAWAYTHKIGLGGQSDIYASKGYPIGGSAITQQDTFRVLDVGNYLVFDGAVLHIDSLTTSSHIVCTRISAYSILRGTANSVSVPDAASGGEWSIETPSFSATHGYPRACCFFQDRLWFAGTTVDQKQSIWGSVTDDFENFAKGQVDDAALDFTVSSGEFEQILWMAPFQGNIICGTYKGEYIINGGSGQLVSTGVGATITPTNVSVLLQSLYGSTAIQPAIIQNDLIYVQRGKLTAYQFTFNIYQSIFASKNLNLLNNIITVAGFKEIVYQQNPYFQVWFTDLAGNLIGLTYEKLNDVWGWHRVFTGVDTGDQVISVATIPSQDQLSDELWLVCQRTLNGVVTFTIEILDPNLYLDCATRVVFSPTVTQVNGLTYLIGRNIWFNIDGQVIGPILQATDSFKFPAGINGSSVQVGLNYLSDGLTVRPEVNAGGQTIQGITGRWSRIWARLYNSGEITLNNQFIQERTPSDNLAQGIGYDTEDVKFEGNLGWDPDKRLRFQQTNPLPTAILGIFGTIEIGEQ